MPARYGFGAAIQQRIMIIANTGKAARMPCKINKYYIYFYKKGFKTIESYILSFNFWYWATVCLDPSNKSGALVRDSTIYGFSPNCLEHAI